MPDLQAFGEGCQQLSLVASGRDLGTVPALDARGCMTAQKGTLAGLWYGIDSGGADSHVIAAGVAALQV